MICQITNTRIDKLINCSIGNLHSWGSAPNPARYQSIKKLKAKTPKTAISGASGALLNALFIGKNSIAENRFSSRLFGVQCFGIGSRGFGGVKRPPSQNYYIGVLNGN